MKDCTEEEDGLDGTMYRLFIVHEGAQARRAQRDLQRKLHFSVTFPRDLWRERHYSKLRFGKHKNMVVVQKNNGTSQLGRTHISYM